MSRTPNPHADQIIKLYQEGMQPVQIAHVIGISRKTVATFTARNRDACPIRKPKVVPMKNIASRLAHYPNETRMPAPMDHPWPTYVRLVPAGARDHGKTAFSAVTLRQTSIEARAS